MVNPSPMIESMLNVIFFVKDDAKKFNPGFGVLCMWCYCRPPSGDRVALLSSGHRTAAVLILGLGTAAVLWSDNIS